MNPDQLIQRMLDGDRIVIVAPKWEDVPALSEQLWDAAFAAQENGRLRLYRASGQQRIVDHRTGGQIRFLSALGFGSLRGHTADVVLVPNDAGQDLLGDATAAVTATGGTVVKYFEEARA